MIQLHGEINISLLCHMSQTFQIDMCGPLEMATWRVLRQTVRKDLVATNRCGWGLLQ